VSPLTAEFLGTAILIVLGDGVVANVLLNKSKGQNSGWIVITTGWAFAVFVAVFATARISGAHLNPAVSVGLAVTGSFAWALVPGYIVAQILGAFVGAAVVWLAYLPHWAVTEDSDAKRAIFCTAPGIRQSPANFLCEFIATFVFILGVLTIKGAVENPLSSASVPIDLGALGALPVALLVWAIGLSLGGPTGYAINPARDLGPRLAHALLPIAGKSHSDWAYAWIPILGPLAGAAAAAALYIALGKY
jgi:glycerol uptake facilitator protein